MNPDDGFVGAALPPPGVTPNPAHPESIAWRLILANCLWPAVTIPIVAMRLYTAGNILKRYHLDDCKLRMSPSSHQMSPNDPADHHDYI